MRAASYAQLDFPGTYWLAFRDLPHIIRRHVQGTAALDFGCGAGRSARFLKRLGFAVTGIDVSQSMLELARKADPAGSYIRVDDGDYSPLDGARFDLIQCAFPFDN
jgi:2-polyprenyl-3-methyl-5-hydroxy-6-metoxy-1,4-benzoquinol methylase